uniref:DUF423 domain-containing protein n=1 Tax=Eucampia antarctica TaxID=49252 RepID=A0A7S2R8Q1_9STRA|mmetsp:Transcript_18715/g.18026  ORF Transcript_18715/g.18026 Transcript_18715/m.18026 type:complete len:146 (+) Transcript_18715:93-530(+)
MACVDDYDGSGGGDGGDFALRQCAAFLGSTGVGAGAFGAHYLKDTLSKKPNGVANWKMAVMYQLVHATAVLAISAYNSNTTKDTAHHKKMLAWSGKLMTVGTVLFSGSIYGLCLDVGPKKLLGPTTPIGGLLMIGGWIMIGMGTK